MINDAMANTSTTMTPSNPRWLAPEVVSGDPFTKNSDVYSFGVVMWEMLTLEIPWKDFEVWTIVRMKREGKTLSEPDYGKIPGADGPPPEWLKSYVELMHSCWAFDPKARPSIEHVAGSLRSLQA